MAVSNEGRGGASDSQFEKALLDLKSVLEVSDDELVNKVLADTGGRFMEEAEMRLDLRANLITYDHFTGRFTTFVNEYTEDWKHCVLDDGFAEALRNALVLRLSSASITDEVSVELASSLRNDYAWSKINSYDLMWYDSFEYDTTLEEEIKKWIESVPLEKRARDMMSATRYYRDGEGGEMLDSPGQLYLLRLMTNEQFVSEPVSVTVSESDLQRWRKAMGDRVITNLIPEGNVELLVPFAKSMLKQLSKEVESAKWRSSVGYSSSKTRRTPASGLKRAEERLERLKHWVSRYLAPALK